MTPCFRLLFSNRHRRYSSPFLCSIKAHCTTFESNHYFSEPGELVWKQPELSCSSPATKYIYVIFLLIWILLTCGPINDLIWFDLIWLVCYTPLLFCYPCMFNTTSVLFWAAQGSQTSVIYIPLLFCYPCMSYTLHLFCYPFMFNSTPVLLSLYVILHFCSVILVCLTPLLFCYPCIYLYVKL